MGLKALDEPTLLRGFADEHPGVAPACGAARRGLSGRQRGIRHRLMSRSLQTCPPMPMPLVRLQLAYSLGFWHDARMPRRCRVDN